MPRHIFNTKLCQFLIVVLQFLHGNTHAWLTHIETEGQYPLSWSLIWVYILCEATQLAEYRGYWRHPVCNVGCESATVCSCNQVLSLHMCWNCNHTSCCRISRTTTKHTRSSCEWTARTRCWKMKICAKSTTCMVRMGWRRVDQRVMATRAGVSTIKTLVCWTLPVN